jgi:hypothetical protein
MLLFDAKVVGVKVPEGASGGGNRACTLPIRYAS